MYNIQIINIGGHSYENIRNTDGTQIRLWIKLTL